MRFFRRLGRGSAAVALGALLVTCETWRRVEIGTYAADAHRHAGGGRRGSARRPRGVVDEPWRAGAASPPVWLGLTAVVVVGYSFRGEAGAIAAPRRARPRAQRGIHTAESRHDGSAPPPIAISGSRRRLTGPVKFLVIPRSRSALFRRRCAGGCGFEPGTLAFTNASDLQRRDARPLVRLGVVRFGEIELRDLTAYVHEGNDAANRCSS